MGLRFCVYPITDIPGRQFEIGYEVDGEPSSEECVDLNDVIRSMRETFNAEPLFTKDDVLLLRALADPDKPFGPMGRNPRLLDLAVRIEKLIGET
jgi:hypothetical protein